MITLNEVEKVKRPKVTWVVLDSVLGILMHYRYFNVRGSRDKTALKYGDGFHICGR